MLLSLFSMCPLSHYIGRSPPLKTSHGILTWHHMAPSHGTLTRHPHTASGRCGNLSTASPPRAPCIKGQCPPRSSLLAKGVYGFDLPVTSPSVHCLTTLPSAHCLSAASLQCCLSAASVHCFYYTALMTLLAHDTALTTLLLSLHCLTTLLPHCFHDTAPLAIIHLSVSISQSEAYFSSTSFTDQMLIRC